jgi:hypothetical protein
MAEDVRGVATHQVFAVAIGEHQALMGIEGEDGDVDLRHHGPEQRGGLLRTEPLRAQRLGQGVDLQHHVPERIVGDRRPRADREVVFAQRGEQVRYGLQRADDAIAEDEHQPDPGADHQHGDRDAGEPGEAAQPEQGDSRQHRRQSRRNRQEGDAAVVGKVHDTRCRSRRR